MTLPTSLRAYEDCRTLFEGATLDPKGIRAKLGTYETCVNMRTRMHYFRKLDRAANAETYPRDHTLHGQSLYDDFVVQIMQDEDAEFWLYVQPRSSKILAIENLSEVGEPIDVDADEVHLIEDQTNG